MKKRYLYNQKNKSELVNKIQIEKFNRKTCSFYKYVNLSNLAEYRDSLYLEWSNLEILGRVYIAKEGMNAQVSIPEHNFKTFINSIKQKKEFNNIKIKEAIEEGTSFLKLVIKIKKEIVSYQIPSDEYNIGTVGKHLDYKEFNKAIEQGATIIDMRNYYEGEVGKFENAIVPDVDTSRHLLPEV